MVLGIKPLWWISMIYIVYIPSYWRNHRDEKDQRLTRVSQNEPALCSFNGSVSGGRGSILCNLHCMTILPLNHPIQKDFCSIDDQLWIFRYPIYGNLHIDFIVPVPCDNCCTLCTSWAYFAGAKNDTAPQVAPFYWGIKDFCRHSAGEIQLESHRWPSEWHSLKMEIVWRWKLYDFLN